MVGGLSDRSWHELTLKIGGPVVFFMSWIATMTALLAAAAVTAPALRWWRIRGKRRSLHSLEGMFVRP